MKKQALKLVGGWAIEAMLHLAYGYAVIILVGLLVGAVVA